MDPLIAQLPFFTPEHRNLAQGVAQFVTQEIEPRAASEEDVEGLARDFVNLLACAGLLNYSVTETKPDVRSLCLIREALAYSSSLADLAFIMQGLGTFAIARAAPEDEENSEIAEVRDAFRDMLIRLDALGEPERDP